MFKIYYKSIKTGKVTEKDTSNIEKARAAVKRDYIGNIERIYGVIDSNTKKDIYYDLFFDLI